MKDIMLENYKLEGNVLIEGYDPIAEKQLKENAKDINKPYWLLVTESRQNGSILQAEISGFSKFQYNKDLEEEWCAEIMIGGVKGYIPLSQLDSSEERMRGLAGLKVAFVVFAINNQEEYFVGSRTVAIKKMSEQALKQLRIGQTVTGVIRQVFDANLLVDVGGIVASIPVGEIAYTWIDNLRDYYSIGQHIDVKITGINRELRKVDASIKALLPDPFVEGLKNYKNGGEYVGYISGVTKSGYFINLPHGISGKAPLKNSVYQTGDKVFCRFGKVTEKEINGKIKHEINLKIIKKL